MKRSEYPSKKIYWKPNYQGYTNDLKFAGHYWANEIEGAAGSRGDWIIEPIWCEVIASHE